MTLYKSFLLVLITPIVLSCGTSLDNYENTTPEFDLPRYFDGEVTAWGIVQDYSTKLTRRFCVDIVGTWQGNQGQLHETFYYPRFRSWTRGKSGSQWCDWRREKIRSHLIGEENFFTIVKRTSGCRYFSWFNCGF